MSRILAIDYGTKRCGIAVSDPMRMIANPVDTILTVKILEYVKNYSEQNDVDTIVIGKPTQMNGKPSQSWPFILEFAEKLKTILPNVQINFHDERFTSKMASAAIALSGMPKYKRESKALIDRTSAVIILQSYLE